MKLNKSMDKYVHSYIARNSDRLHLFPQHGRTLMLASDPFAFS